MCRRGLERQPSGDDRVTDAPPAQTGINLDNTPI
jgi:hypothetical protein